MHWCVTLLRTAGTHVRRGDAVTAGGGWLSLPAPDPHASDGLLAAYPSSFASAHPACRGSPRCSYSGAFLMKDPPLRRYGIAPPLARAAVTRKVLLAGHAQLLRQLILNRVGERGTGEGDLVSTGREEQGRGLTGRRPPLVSLSNRSAHAQRFVSWSALIGVLPQTAHLKAPSRQAVSHSEARPATAFFQNARNADASRHNATGTRRLHRHAPRLQATPPKAQPTPRPAAAHQATPRPPRAPPCPLRPLAPRTQNSSTPRRSRPPQTGSTQSRPGGWRSS